MAEDRLVEVLGDAVTAVKQTLDRQDDELTHRGESVENFVLRCSPIRFRFGNEETAMRARQPRTAHVGKRIGSLTIVEPVGRRFKVVCSCGAPEL